MSELTNLIHKFLFHNRFTVFLYMFRALRTHHQEVKIVLYSICYHHTSRWPSGAPNGHLLVWWYQKLYNTILTSNDEHIVLETCREV